MEQLTFGLSNKEEKPRAISVKELNLYIKDLIDRDGFLNNVYVKGEISNYKRHYTGHLYFTLKDDESLIKCVMFKSYTSHLTFEPKDGMQVLVLGTIAVYERDGVYQIYVKAIDEDGVGSLYKKYEELKSKLEEKGYFDSSLKKKIPYFPSSIGVVTSKTGSVIKDIINVTTRRNPNVNLKLYPAAVQGVDAYKTIVKGIEFFNYHKNVDVIIIARGGGSIEDLWPFNEEETAKAIYNSEIPIISAVGHETDFTIADFVADLRAPTPSAAGELAVPDIKEVKWKIQNYDNKLKVLLKRRLENLKVRVSKLTDNKIFKDPKSLFNTRKLKLDQEIIKLNNNIKVIVNNKRLNFVKQNTLLDGLSPLKTLNRGYLIGTLEDGKIIKSIKDVKTNDNVILKAKDGDIKAKVL